MGYCVLIAIIAAVATTAVPALDYTTLSTFLSVQAAICAFALMAISLFMATRSHLVERMFGGLDKVYVAHRRVGYTILMLILVHYFQTPNFRGLFLNKELNDLARGFGSYAFYGLCALIILSIVKGIPFLRVSIPYHVWYHTHRFIGLAFVALAVHQFFIKKPFDQSEPIAFVLNCLAILGIASYAYTQVFSHFRKRDYQVCAVERTPSTTILSVRPLGRPLKLTRGQFAILHVRRRELREPHPFTVASIGDDGELKFAIRPSGDFTRRLGDHLRCGDVVRLEGGYGRFHFRHGGEKQVWIAGGVGVTPFLSMLPDIEGYPECDVAMVYCVRDRSEAIGLDTFVSASEKLPNFRFLLHASAEGGRLDARMLADFADIRGKQADLFFCGPAALRKALVGGLTKLGKKPRRIWFEHFEFR